MIGAVSSAAAMPARPQRSHLVTRYASVALLPAAAFAVHQLRYWLAFGSAAGAVLRAQGHSYLHSVVPWIILLIGISAGVFLRALGRAFSGHSSAPRYTLSFTALWLVCAGSLVAIYSSQEFLEGLFATGHPGGLVGIFGYGGWWAIPAALAVGLVLAAIFHGARWVLQEVAQWCAAPPPAPLRPPAAIPVRRRILLSPLAPLVGGWSDRGPPQAAG
jgi:hypothetical protein